MGLSLTSKILSVLFENALHVRLGYHPWRLSPEGSSIQPFQQMEPLSSTLDLLEIGHSFPNTEMF